jgi:hypothetical protein
MEFWFCVDGMALNGFSACKDVDFGYESLAASKIYFQKELHNLIAVATLVENHIVRLRIRTLEAAETKMYK